MADARAEEERMSALMSVEDSGLASIGDPPEGDMLRGCRRLEILRLRNVNSETEVEVVVLK